MARRRAVGEAPPSERKESDQGARLSRARAARLGNGPRSSDRGADGRIIVLDVADPRLEKAREFGANVTIDNGKTDAVAEIMELTGGVGADVAIEAVGAPETFELCTDLIRPGGRVANVGVHGHRATLHLERLWIRGVTITTGLVDTFTTPKLLRLIAEGRLDPTPFATHRFELDETTEAYDTFADAASTNALKVVLTAHPAHLSARERAVAVTA